MNVMSDNQPGMWYNNGKYLQFIIYDNVLNKFLEEYWKWQNKWTILLRILLIN